MAHRQQPTPSGLSENAAAMLVNRLAGLNSLYLRQHTANPIAWQPWDETTLSQARALDRPILLSIGYASCHWCHRMGRESFDDPEIAALVNAGFVPIKVDREERPDIDGRYQRALEALTGQRGWPLTLFLTPEGRAFGGGTYYPPTADDRLPAFRDVLSDHAARYRRGGVSAPPTPSATTSTTKRKMLDTSAHDSAATTILDGCDPLAGGLRGRPKFPRLPIIELLLRAGERGDDARFGEAARRGLDAMCYGALFDPVDGGFARYCSDAHWQVPHYEKMLSDNAQFIAVLSRAHRQTPSPLYAACVAETVGWLDRRLALPSGAFGASLSAETDGIEGDDRLWHHAEIAAALGDEARFFASIYAVAAPAAPPAPLYRLRRGVPREQEVRVRACLDRLRAARSGRAVAPRDDKLIAHWNGLAIRALAIASTTFGEPAWLTRAERAFQACLAGLSRADGTVWRVPGTIAGQLGDHAALGLAALALYEVTANEEYRDWAHRWAETARAQLPESDSIEDDAIPSDSALALDLFARLSVFSDAAWYDQVVANALRDHGATIAAEPFAHAGLLNVADTMLRRTSVTVFADPSTTAARQWRDALLRHADAATMIVSEASDADHPRAVICRDRLCHPPFSAIKDVCHALGYRQP